ncbi:hypothetical protein FKM82_018607 [Ascaphus truei]
MMRVQDHSICTRSPRSPHCLGQSGEAPAPNFANLTGVRYHLINTLYEFSFNVVQIELLAAALKIAVHSSSSNGPVRSVSHCVMNLVLCEPSMSAPTTSLYRAEMSPRVSVPRSQSFSKLVSGGLFRCLV